MATVPGPVRPAPGPCSPLVCPAKTQAERWAELDTPGTRHRYAVSTHGRVRNMGTGRLLTLQVQVATGYHVVNLGRVYRQQLVHRLVAMAFLAPAATGMEVDHHDFGRTNNRVSNLRWLPKQANAWRWKKAEYVAEREGVDPDEVMASMASDYRRRRPA